MTQIVMRPEEQAALWRQRMFEAEAGMTRYLLDHHAGGNLAEWMQVRSRIFENLPSPENMSPDGWKKAFFRTQALAEKFLISHYGYQALADWARSNAAIYKALEPEPAFNAAAVIERVAKQAELYGSSYRLGDNDDQAASLHITHCAIWDYREQARARGVPITLKSPCEYCTEALSAIISSKGCQAHFQLFEDGASHGCVWHARAASHPPHPGQDAAAGHRKGITYVPAP